MLRTIKTSGFTDDVLFALERQSPQSIRSLLLSLAANLFITYAQRHVTGSTVYIGISQFVHCRYVVSIADNDNNYDSNKFLPARRYASAGLCDSDVSVCLSVRLSVTRRYCA